MMTIKKTIRPNPPPLFLHGKKKGGTCHSPPFFLPQTMAMTPSAPARPFPFDGRGKGAALKSSAPDFPDH